MPASRLSETLDRIDFANSEDPNTDASGRPKELVYGQRMSAWLMRLAPAASEELQLACRAQHIQRWQIPRAQFAFGRDGYREWRTALAHFHADTVSRILQECGYDETATARVAALVRKEKYKTDPEAQTLEDTACLVFLENHFAEFAAHKDESKLVGILRKTWRKMSPQGQKAALSIKLQTHLLKLVERALAEGADDDEAG
jgi:Domain of unknown function (DUF4202)